jgi:hypothetical protein
LPEKQEALSSPKSGPVRVMKQDNVVSTLKDRVDMLKQKREETKPDWWRGWEKSNAKT